VGCSVRGKADPAATESLRRLLDDPTPAVRVASGEALVRLGVSEGLDRLVRELDTPGSDVLGSLDALASLGPRAGPATAAIQAKIQKGLEGLGRANGESGARFVDLAAADLLKILAGE